VHEAETTTSAATCLAALKTSLGEERKARVFSYCLKHNRILRNISGLKLRYGPEPLGARATLAVGWGRKRSGVSAAKHAAKNNTDLLLLEDGFIRSVGRNDPSASIVVDDLGIYYDASSESRLELLSKETLTNDKRLRARRLKRAWVEEGVSKYNAGREPPAALPKDFVLVVDQVAGDKSIAFGGASQQHFDKMLAAALDENPRSHIVVKTHPDCKTRARAGHFDLAALSSHPRITVITDSSHPVALIRAASAVYVVTSQMGFEALLHDRPVRCFGMPFYAGWGLTHDAIEAPSRRHRIELEALVHAALVDYSIYLDPVLGTWVEPEQIIATMGAARMQIKRTPPKLYAVGFSIWKRPILRRFCRYSKVIYCKPDCVPKGATVALWGTSNPKGLPCDTAVIRIEDGFLRSRGLGANLTQPYSWCFDRKGLHFDPTQVSDLEEILIDGSVSEYYIDRARALRERISQLGISKYNLEGRAWTRSTSERTLLVAGQVEDDASIRVGSPNVRRNVDLLRAVRASNPDAWIVYKPHPDVVSGLRSADEDVHEIKEIADEIVTDVSTTDLLSRVDHLHVMTSQIGFEAIIRSISVTCHGIPFYSGWGLTDDFQQVTRRNRSVSMDELLAAALILYPSYTDPKSGQLMSPEQTIELLSRASGKAQRSSFFRGMRRTWVRLRRRGIKAQHGRYQEGSNGQQA
jgi:capsular polysaccharide export protein